MLAVITTIQCISGSYLYDGGDDGDDDDDCDVFPLVVRACEAPLATDSAPPSPASRCRCRSSRLTTETHAGPRTKVDLLNYLAAPPCCSSQRLSDAPCALYSTDGISCCSTMMLPR